MNKDLIAILLVLAVLTGLVVWDTYSWKECRQTNSASYCVRVLGR